MNSILKQFELSPSQAQAVETRFRDVVVSAGAGTGKTRTIVARFLSLLDEDIDLRKIVAITFTRKAAREMRNRVRNDIGRYLAHPNLDSDEYNRWQDYQTGMDAARIGTIHNLCGEILRSHPAEAGIDPRFNVLDEVQSTLLVKEAVEAALAWAVQTAVNDAALRPTMIQLFNLLEERELQALIGTMLYHRSVMIDLVENLPSDEIFNYWQEQLETVQAETLETVTADPQWQASLRTLRNATPLDHEDRRVAQQQMVLRIMAEAGDRPPVEQCHLLCELKTINLVGGSQNAWAGGKEEATAVKEALRTVRDLWRQTPLLSLEMNELDQRLAAIMPAIYALFRHANQAYQTSKEEREALDFDDLERLAVDLLAREEDVLSYWQNQIQALLVDEFQDTNEQQRHFIRLLCPDPGKLFIVGDAKQSIYRFRGADVTVFQTERETIKATGGRTVNLDTSYRAHMTLLEGMNRLLKPVLGDDSPQRPAYVAPFNRLEAAVQELPEGLPAPFVEFHLALGNKAEALPVAAGGLASRLAGLVQNSPLTFGDVAILCRASSAFQYYENALDKAGIPYLTVAGKGFYDRPEIRDLLNALQATADPRDDLALAGYLRSPGIGLSDESLYYLAQARLPERSLWEMIQQGVTLSDNVQQQRLKEAVDMLTTLHQMAGRTRVADLLKHFLDQTNYLAALRLAGHHRALRNVGKLLADVHSSELVNVSDFLDYAGTLKDSGSREGEARSTAGGVVQIMSIHAAKGLEFPVVVLGDAASSGSYRGKNVIIDPTLGVLLGTKNEDDQQAAAFQLGSTLNDLQESAESDRLLYVALTRAEKLLLINGHARTTSNGRLSMSGWLRQLGDITGLTIADLANYDSAGEGSFNIELSIEDTAVQATFYEPNFSPVYTAPPSDRKEISGETLTRVQQNLNYQISLPPQKLVKTDRTNRVWQVIPTTKKPQAPAWLIGTLVHEAIAMWRFPDSGFDRWIEARAGSRGLTDHHQMADAIRESRRLLERFKHWQGFPEIEQARRRFHELPFNYQSADRTITGYIDLLYELDGRWTIIDFKTDDLKRYPLGRDLMEQYTSQIRGYGAAVQRLLGQKPQLILCYLNGPDGIITRPVPYSE